jgi:hypothetical protein
MEISSSPIADDSERKAVRQPAIPLSFIALRFLLTVLSIPYAPTARAQASARSVPVTAAPGTSRAIFPTPGSSSFYRSLKPTFGVELSISGPAKTRNRSSSGPSTSAPARKPASGSASSSGSS